MLNRRLEAERQGAGCFELSYFKTDGDIQRSKVATALPTREVKRIMRLFREKLGLVDPGFGIDAATIVASRVEPLEARQINLLRQSQEARCVEELAALVDSLQNRLGEARVFALAPHQSYIPERATKRISAAEALIASRKQAPAKPRRERRSVPLSSGSGLGEGGFKLRGVDAPVLGATPQFERPIRLFAKPQPIEATAALPDAPPIFFRWRKIIHRIARAEGPERICPEWWRDNDAAAPEEERIRDYYRVENTEGMRFWVFREGLYGGNRMPRWYIHGVFA
jgi:protein ImuB